MAETTYPFGLFVTLALALLTVFNFMPSAAQIYGQVVYYQKSSKVMHEFRSCYMPSSLRTNDPKGSDLQKGRQLFVIMKMKFRNLSVD